MGCKGGVFRVFLVCFLSFSFYLTSHAYAKVLGPGWHMITADESDSAESGEAGAPVFSSSTTSSTPASATEITPEIKELARALQYHPRLIYEYVRNKIDYVPYYGSLKGATLTYLDGCGNDFDQASLMIALLRESTGKRPDITIGTVQYVYGRMTIDGSILADWFGTDQVYDIIKSVIKSGGIPYYSIWADGTAKIDRIWVRAEIDGVPYVFDPALTFINNTDKIDIAGATGYNLNDLLSEAQAGATIGADFVKNLNENNIRNKLKEYSTNMLNTIRSQYPNSDVKEIISGRDIVELINDEYWTTHPLTTSDEVFWDEAPADKTAKLQIVHEGIDHLFYIPEIAGKRLTLTYSSTKPRLLLDGVFIVEGHSTTSGTKYDFTMMVDHPYSGGYGDQTAPYRVKSGASYAIVSDFGDTSDFLLQKRQRILDKYLHEGLSHSTEKVRGESLYLMGLTWMKELVLTNRILSAVAETVSIWHHNIGLMAQEGGYYIDVRAMAVSTLPKHNIYDSNGFDHFKILALIGSAFEHGILEQLMGSDNPGISTVKILQIANEKNLKIFWADINNHESIGPQLYHIDKCPVDDMYNDIMDGYALILPQDCDLGAGSWSGSAYISKHFDASFVDLKMLISGGYHGGYAANEGDVKPPKITKTVSDQVYNSTSPVNVYRNTTPVPTNVSKDPVDMASGSFLHDNTDLALGGTAPLGLGFSRSYSSSNNFEKRTLDEDTQVVKPLGYGWTHNYDIYLDRHSSGDPGLGSRQPLDAAGLITALYAALDIIKNEDTLTGWVVTSLVSNWAVDQLIDNAVTVHLGSKLMQFIKLPDDTYAPPPGVTTQLIDNGSTYSLEERFGTRLDFDTNDRITQLTDVDGNTLRFSYSGDKLSEVRDAFGRKLTLTYTGDKLTKVTDSTGRFVSYGYTGNDLTSYTDPDGKVWNYAYIDANNPHMMTSLTDPLSITTATNTYDSLGRVKTQTTPRQTGSATYNFYFSGFRNVEEDPDGYTIVYHYDEKGRPIETENQLGHKSYKYYDGQFHVITSIDPRDNYTDLYYDGEQNLVRTINALTLSTDYIYDAQFRLTDTVDPYYHGIHIDYDSEHHPVLSKYGVTYNTNFYPVDSGIYQTGATYYVNGLAWNKTDGLGTVSTLTYDSYGNPSTSIVGSHQPVTTVYNSKGWLTGLTDQVGAVTTFPLYNNRGLLRKKTDPLLRDTIMEYDNAGRLDYVIDRKGDLTDYAYTPTGKVNSITYQDASTVNFTYNHHDDLTGMQDSLGATTYVYDAAHQLTSQTDPHGFVVSYAYDEAGNLTELTYPGNKKVIYTYDELNRLETVTIDWLNPKPVATYHYDAAGMLEWVDNFNGTETHYYYDNANRLTDLENKKADSSIIAAYYFTLDANGNRTQIVKIEPLTPVLSLGTVDYTYNVERNRLLTAGATSFAYDYEGQMASKGGTAYTFDYEHRLKSIGSTDQFFYDGNDTRLKAVRNGVETRYIYDAGGNLIAEADGLNNITKYFIHGAGLMAMVMPTDEVYTYHFDAVGSTIAMTDQSQMLVNAYAYTPFGIIANEVVNVPQPFKFVGQHGVMTEPNGIYYMRARYYDPEVGRFISEDPLGFDGGDVNLMAYVGNNPILLIDPDGLREVTSNYYSGTIRIPSSSIESLKSNSDKFQTSFEAAGVVAWEAGKMSAMDAGKVFITSKIPSTPAGGFAMDKSFSLIEIAKNVAGDFREIGERVGRRIRKLFEE